MKKTLVVALWVCLILGMYGCSEPEVAQGQVATITAEPNGATPVGNSGPCTEDLDCPFGERCLEGMCTEDPGASDQSGCTDDSDCPDGMLCSEETGACVEASEHTEVTLEEAQDCVSGQTRPCGIKVGECDYGVQTCEAGVWSECVGGVGPEPELCNGLDDNCDGIIELTEMDEDQDGFRICDGDCDDTDASIYPQAPEGCDGKDNDCDEIVDENGDSFCDDGLFCNGREACLVGSCEAGDVVDCAGLSGECTTGLCDETLDQCTPEPLPDGLLCDDQDLCTGAGMCAYGECLAGTPVDCSLMGDACNVGVCNGNTGNCEPTPVTDGTACEDGSYCTLADECLAGVCSAGGPRDCSALSDSCNEGVCLEQTQSCEVRALSNATACDDGRFCTVADGCFGGTCVGEPRDCSGLNAACVVGQCDETIDSCVSDALADGTTCDDGAFCTSGDQCLQGSCASGAPLDCSAVTGGDTCYDGMCNEALAQCVAIENNTCDPCIEGAPTAVAGPDDEVVPNTWVYFLGSGSSDPNGQNLTYSWEMTQQPDGSSATLVTPTSVSPSMLADLAGDYEICLTVTNIDGCPSQPSCLQLTVKPQVSLHLELTWDTTGSDLDLHYRAPQGTFYDGYPSCGTTSSDVYWCSSNPDWGSGNLGAPDLVAVNDPILDVDNVIGYGPENINQEVLLNSPQAQRVGVHYWRDAGGGLTNARVRIYVDGELQLETSQAMMGPQFWEVADIVVSDNGTSVTVTPLSAIVYDRYDPSGH